MTWDTALTGLIQSLVGSKQPKSDVTFKLVEYEMQQFLLQSPFELRPYLLASAGEITIRNDTVVRYSILH